MPKRNTFLEQIKRSREASKTGVSKAAESKPISEMSEEELAAEESRLRAEIRAAKEQALEAGREELAGQGARRAMFPKKKRRSWK